MDQLYIQETTLTPEVIFRPSDGTFVISGKSIPEDAETFYSPILDWVDQFSKNVSCEVHLTIELEFFNISSSKRLLFLMYKLNELVDQGEKVEITWMCKENDDDMYEVGQDYAFMVNIPFHFYTNGEKMLA